MDIKTFEGQAKVRVVCRKPGDADCPNEFTACEPECCACEHHELMILDQGDLVAKGFLADRPEPVVEEPEAE